MLAEIDASRWVSVYVASFSGNVDVLSQWRAYGHAALALSPESLSSLAKEHAGNLRLLPVVYGPDLQVALADDLIQYCCTYQRSRTWREGDPEPVKPTGPFGSVPPRVAMALAAPLFKHFGFAEEREWRFVYFPVQDPPHLAPCVRASGHSLLPYVEIPLQSEAVPFPISHVFLGPLAASEENERALTIALDKLGPSARGSVLLSDTPLRR